jgi:hypothetical protein
LRWTAQTRREDRSRVASKVCLRTKREHHLRCRA